MTAPTAAVKVSRFVAGVMSGSDIAVPESGSGYDPLIGHEYRRTGGHNGGTYRLTAPALRDLAEFCDCLAIPEEQGGGMNGTGNPSGARALRSLAEKCLKLSTDLDTPNNQESTMTRFAVVNNVNTDRSRHADFDIHVEGCSALKKLDPRDIEIIEAADAAAVAEANNEEIRGSGSFDEDSVWEHRSHTCVKKLAPTGRKGGTGPRYTEAQIKAGLAAKAEGKSRKAVAEAAGVKSPNYFNKVLEARGIAEAVKRTLDGEKPAKAVKPRRGSKNVIGPARDTVTSKRRGKKAAPAAMPTSTREAKGEPRKWTAEVSCGGQPVAFDYPNSDTLREVERAAVAAARSAIAREEGSDASVVISKQLKGDAEPVRDRSVYVYRTWTAAGDPRIDVQRSA